MRPGPGSACSAAAGRRPGGLLLLLLLLALIINPPLSQGLNTEPATLPDAPHPNSVAVPAEPAAPRLPVFLEEPRDGFVTKARPALLNCSVVHSEKAYFSCNGEALSQSGQHSERDSVDVQGRVRRVLTVLIHREQVEEYFDEFRCQCDAWSSVGQTSSRAATVATGYLNKEFEVPPYSQSVTLGSQVELRCHPPNGQPQPRIYWMKNKMEIQVEREPNYLQSADGHLIIVQVRPEDVGNFTCVAENIINRRISPPARLDIFVDGGWSSWAPWTDCDARCGSGNQRRQRVCNNPAPSLNGVYCPGEAEQAQACSRLCQTAGAWSPWSSWSSCSPLCAHYRRRTCSAPRPSPGGQYCRGRDQATAACSGAMCRPEAEGPGPSTRDSTVQAVQADLALLIGLAVALAVFCCVSLASIRLIRRKGRSGQSIYSMAALPCRGEFLEKPDSREGAAPGGKAARETHFSFPGARRCNLPEDKQVLQLDFPASATSSPRPAARRPAPASPRHGPLAPASPRHGPTAPVSPTTSEHQYDVPFSHLLPRRHNKRPPGEGDGYSAPGLAASLLPGSAPLLHHEWPPAPHPPSPDSDYSGLLPVPSARSAASLLPPGLEPECFARVCVGAEGGRLSLPDWGVSLLVPRGALEPGYTEEVFLAVVQEPRDLPSLSQHQARLSPVVLAGPPGLSFQKPVVLSFGHCAALQDEAWEIGVYHCHSMFPEAGAEQSWVKLATVGQEAAGSPLLAHLDLGSCFLLTDFLSRFCLVGQSRPGQAAARSLAVLLLGRLGQATGEPELEVHVVGDTTAALHAAITARRKLGLRLLQRPRALTAREGGGELCLRAGRCGPGWSVRPRAQQELPGGQVWAGEPGLFFSLALEHRDPAVQQIALELTVFQKLLPEAGVGMSVAVDLSALSCPAPRSSACSSLAPSSSGCSSLPSSPLQAFKLPAEVRSALCQALDREHASGVDWRSLAVGLRLGRHLDFYRGRASPTDCLLSLWEAQQTDQAAITDLLNIVRVIGKAEVAARLEKEVGSWV